MNELQITAMLQQLARIADALEKMAAGGMPAAPDYQKPMEEYAGFDWSSINATVVASDADGPSHIEHAGYLYQRRSPKNKYEPAIWYSRSAGRDEAGETVYQRLITFRTMKTADPLPAALGAQVHNQAPRPAPAAPAAPASQAARPPAAAPKPGPASQAARLPGTTPRAADKEPAGPGEVKGPTSYAKYYQTAASKQFGLARAEAVAIAQAAGIDVPQATEQTDYTPALRALWFFAEARGTFKLELETATRLYQGCSRDPERATQALRERFEPAL